MPRRVSGSAGKGAAFWRVGFSFGILFFVISLVLILLCALICLNIPKGESYAPFLSLLVGALCAFFCGYCAAKRMGANAVPTAFFAAFFWLVLLFCACLLLGLPILSPLSLALRVLGALAAAFLGAIFSLRAPKSSMRRSQRAFLKKHHKKN